MVELAVVVVIGIVTLGIAIALVMMVPSMWIHRCGPSEAIHWPLSCNYPHEVPALRSLALVRFLYNLNILSDPEKQAQTRDAYETRKMQAFTTVQSMNSRCNYQVHPKT